MSSTKDDGPTAQTDDGTQIIVGIGDGAWSDIGQRIEMRGRIVRAVLLPEGTAAGRPTVEILVELPDGRLVHANTTWRLWKGTTDLFTGHESTWEVNT